MARSRGFYACTQVIQKVAAATPENLEALEKELEECLKDHLEAALAATKKLFEEMMLLAALFRTLEARRIT